MKQYLLKFAIFLSPLPFLLWYSVIKDFPERGCLHRALQKNTPVFIFGSSVDSHCSPVDIDKRPISDMIASRIDLRCTGISHGAYQADMFLELCRYAVRHRNKPRIMVFEINLRTFSPECDQRPQYQFVHERLTLQRFPYISFRFRNIDDSTFLKTPVFQYEKPIGIVNDFMCLYTEPNAHIRNRGGFIFHYLYPLREDHRKLQSLVQIAQILNRAQIKPLFYITPIDFQKAETLLGKEFSVHVWKNVSFIQNTLAHNQAPVLDLSHSLDSTCFDYDKLPNEHLNQKGKYFVADTLAAAIRSLEP